jgi:hypothetical protein
VSNATCGAEVAGELHLFTEVRVEEARASGTRDREA